MATNNNSALALRAQADAVRELKARHPEEWQMLIEHFRTAAGLSPHSGQPRRDELQKRVDRYERLLEKYRSQLEASS